MGKDAGGMRQTTGNRQQAARRQVTTTGTKRNAAGKTTKGNAGMSIEAEAISKADVAAMLAGVEDFDKKLESSKKVLENLAAHLGALVRLSYSAPRSTESVIPRLVEMHNQLSSVHHSLEDSFENVRTRYAGLRDKSSAITGGCSRDLELRRKLFDDLGKRIEHAGRDPSKLLQCMKDENNLFSRALDSYNAVLGALSAMRDVENRVNEVFNEFSETMGRIDGLSRTMGEFISHEDTRAFEEELESLRKYREERVARYIR